MKTMLKAPGTKRLKLTKDQPPSNFAYDFNLRSYIKGVSWDTRVGQWKAVCTGQGGHLGYHATEEDAARACDNYVKGNADPRETERDASACMRRHQAFALAPGNVDPVTRRDGGTSSQFKGVSAEMEGTVQGNISWIPRH